jgi:hypothetical protein
MVVRQGGREEVGEGRRQAGHEKRGAMVVRHVVKLLGYLG